MGRKTIVVSVKQGGVAKSWETSRVAAMCLVDPGLFANPASLGLLSDQRALRLPMFDHLEACDLVPGACGWIGIGVDARQFIDFQYYCTPGAYSTCIDATGPVSALPDELVRACLGRPWSVLPESVSPLPRAARHGPSRTRDRWLEDLRASCARAWHQAARSEGKRPRELSMAWMSIRPDLPIGWRLVDCHPDGDSEPDARRAARVMDLLERNGWGWREDLRSTWTTYATDQLMACPKVLAAHRAGRVSRTLARRLPRAHAPSTKGPRL